MSAAPALEFTNGDIKVFGLTACVVEDGRMLLEYPTDEVTYYCMLATTPAYKVTESNMPVGVLVAFLQDMRKDTMEMAILKLPQRLASYAARRKQVDDCVREHRDHLLGGKIETTGACTFVEVRLRVNIGGEQGIIQLELSYGEFSAHPIRYAISASGSDTFRGAVGVAANSIATMLQSKELSRVCAILLDPGASGERT